jgi:Mrp family chromosome partitioning ATPase
MSKVFEALRRLETEPDNISSMLVADAKTILQEPSPAPAEDEAFATTGPPVDFAVAPTQSGTRVMPVRVSIESPLIPFEDTHEKAAEQYRIIRTKLVQHPASPRVIVISSVDSGDGKTVTSINLAATLALKSQVTVLLIDGDLRRGAIADLLGIPETPGLADVLGKTCSRADAIVQLEQFGNLHVLPAGTRLTNPTELLDSPQWQLLIQELRQDFEYIIVDSPPLN